MFTLLRFRFYPLLLMKTLSVHITPFSNKCAMKTIGVHIAPAYGAVNPFFKTKPLLGAVKKAPITSLNAIVIISLLTKDCEAFSNVSVFGVHTENEPVSKRTVFRFMLFH